MGAVPVQIAGVDLLRGSESSRFEDVLRHAEGNPVDEIVLPQCERHRRCLLEPAEVLQVPPECEPAGVQCGTSACPPHPNGSASRQSEREDRRKDGDHDDPGAEQHHVERLDERLEDWRPDEPAEHTDDDEDADDRAGALVAMRRLEEACGRHGLFHLAAERAVGGGVGRRIFSDSFAKLDQRCRTFIHDPLDHGHDGTLVRGEAALVVSETDLQIRHLLATQAAPGPMLHRHGSRREDTPSDQVEQSRRELGLIHRPLGHQCSDDRRGVIARGGMLVLEVVGGRELATEAAEAPNERGRHGEHE